MEYILYEIDYRRGKLVAHYDKDRLIDLHYRNDFVQTPKETSTNSENPEYRDISFEYEFEDRSLAARTFREQISIILYDPSDIAQKTEAQVSEKGLETFNIKGPLVSTPITVRGHVVAVLVAWSDREETIPKKIFSAVGERVRRMAQLVANDQLEENLGRAQQSSEMFVEYINDNLFRLDNGELWSRSNLRDRIFRNGVIKSVLNALLLPCVGLTRVRLWVEWNGPNLENNGYTIAYSLDSHQDNNETRVIYDKFAGITTENNDPHVKYTRARFRNDPYAQIQHESMFDQPDVNQEKLIKDPQGRWFVGPVVRWNRKTNRKKLSGYISADSHDPENININYAVERKYSEAKQEFQKCAIDLVTDLLEEIVSCERHAIGNSHESRGVNTSAVRMESTIQRSQGSDFAQGQHSLTFTDRFNRSEREHMIKKATTMADKNPVKHERTLFIVIALCEMDLREVDLVAGNSYTPTMGNFNEDDNKKWWFHITDNNEKHQKIPVSKYMLDALRRFRRSMGQSALPRKDETTPLVSKLNGGGPIRTTAQIKRIINAVHEIDPSYMHGKEFGDDAWEKKSDTVD